MKKLLLTSLILCLLLFIACGNQSNPTEPASQPTQSVSEDAQPTQEDATESAKEIRGTVDGHKITVQFAYLLTV